MLQNEKTLEDVELGGLEPSRDASAPELKPRVSSSLRGLRVTFKSVTHEVDSSVEKGKKLKLLDDVSGYLEPYQMTALMGPSGSGKTTLLDVLAGRKTSGRSDGDVRFGGVHASPAFLRRHTGYVEQFDSLVPTLTVTEMLMYTAELKRPRSEPISGKAAAVNRLIQTLGLDSCKDVACGDPMTKGISGGQAKRTNIAIALVSDPRVLFLDEPTSGLDSYSATEVMRLVARLTHDSGTTVVATIHSPTATTFALFDAVLMLVRGSVVYFGQQGEAALSFAAQHWARTSNTEAARALLRAASGPEGDVLQANSQHGASRGEGGSVAEMLVELVTEADRSGRAPELAAAYAGSSLKHENDATLDGYLGSYASAAAADAATALPKPCRRICSATSSLFSLSRTTPSALGPAAASSHGAALPPVASDLEVGSSGSDGRSSGNSSGISGKAAGAMAVAIVQRQQTQLTSGSEIDAETAAALATKSSTSTPWWWGLGVLLRYRTLRNYRDPAWLGPRLADKIIFSLIILTLYLGIGDQFDQSNLVNLGASLFMWCTLPAYGAVAYVPAIVLERRLFVRERADGLYHVATYLLAKILEELVVAVLVSTVFAAYVFYGVQYQGSFGLFWVVYVLTLSIGIMLGYFIAALSPSMDVANAALPAYVTTLLFFAGQLIVYDAIPKYWEWYSRIDFLRYAWGALMRNQFKNHEDQPFTSDGVSLIEYYGLTDVNEWEYVGYLVVFFFAFASLAYLALSFIHHQKR